MHSVNCLYVGEENKKSWKSSCERQEKVETMGSWCVSENIEVKIDMTCQEEQTTNNVSLQNA